MSTKETAHREEPTLESTKWTVNSGHRTSLKIRKWTYLHCETLWAFQVPRGQRTASFTCPGPKDPYLSNELISMDLAELLGDVN